MGDGTITLNKSDLWKYSTFILVAVLVIGALIIFSGGNSTGNSVIPTNPTQQGAINAQALIEGNDPVLGSSDASVSILEFSDFQCPFCARAHFDALAQFKASSYFTNGEVNLIYKQFPLNSIHPQAQKAGEASLCADDQGMFWEYHDALFANQAALDSNSLKSYASQLGLNAGEFEDCLDSGEKASEVSKETAQATSAGGRGTPFFVIVNRETGDATSISGAYPWADFEVAIQSVL